MAWQPREGSKVDGLIAAMRVVAATQPIWTQDEAAKQMGVPRANVPAYVAGACNGGAMFRRTVQNGIELSLQQFPVPAGPKYERYVPPKTAAPRPGSDVRHVNPPRPTPAPTPSPTKLCPGCTRPLCAQQGCVAAAPGAPEAAADALAIVSRPAATPAPTLAPTPQPTPAPTSAPTPMPTTAPTTAPAHEPEIPSFLGTGGTEPVSRPEDAIVPKFDAWESLITGDMRLFGLKTLGDGSVVITSQQLQQLLEAREKRA